MRMRHVAATLSLASVLACSGLGLCWKVLARADHGCCQTTGEMAPARACASAVETVTPLVLAAPTSAGPLDPAMVIDLPFERPTLAPGPTLPARLPPLVLRI